MTPPQIALVQESFAKVAPLADQVARLFYDRLFEIAPWLQPLFRDGDMEAQGRKLMAMLGVAVGNLDQPAELVPAVQELGRRHAGYGVADDDYVMVGEALLWTLAKGLGDQFTLEVKEAWTSVYLFLADTMREAGRGPAAR